MYFKKNDDTYDFGPSDHSALSVEGCDGYVGEEGMDDGSAKSALSRRSKQIRQDAHSVLKSAESLK